MVGQLVAEMDTGGRAESGDLCVRHAHRSGLHPTFASIDARLLSVPCLSASRSW